MQVPPSTLPVSSSSPRAAEELTERLIQSAQGAFRIFSVHIGDQLGLYEVLSQDGALTPGELASRTGTVERYVREWLEQQTVAGLLAVENPDDPAERRRFHLPPGHAEVLADKESLDFLAPLAQLVVGVTGPLDDVLGVFREGGGIPFSSYGADLREGQARMNRAMFLQLLGEEWLPSIRDLDARLRRTSGTRVADIGCGAGWSSIGIALSYPGVVVHGFDLDGASIELARANAQQYGVADRVLFHCRDAGDPGVAEDYDLVLAFECVHDMSDPVAVLETMRRLAGEEGTVLVADERVAHHFSPQASDVEELMYGFSVLHCLPVGMADHPSCGTGTVMRPGTLEQYARRAGFADVEILPIDSPFFRFYRMR